MTKDIALTCWEAFVVSVSAQLATFPILVWYFHQFSLSDLIISTFLFWLISIITLVGFWTSLGIVLLYRLLFTPILQLVANIFLWLPLELFLQVLELVGQLNGLLWNDLFISKELLIFYYLALIFLVFFHQYKNRSSKYLKEISSL